MDSDATSLPEILPPDSEIFAHFARVTDDLITVVDRNIRFVYVNPTSQAIFGLSPSDAIGLPALEFIHPDDRQSTQDALREWMRAKTGDSFSCVNRQVSRDGSAHVMSWRVHPICDAQGKLIYLASTARDITASVDIEDRLELNEARLRALFAGMLDAVVTIDPFGIIQDASDSVFPMFGYLPEELRGQNVRVLMPEPHYSQHDGYLEEYRRTGKTWILGTTREFELVRKDGGSIECELSVSRINVPGKAEPLFCGTFRDVTARRLTQRRIADSERRMRAVFDQEFQLVGLLDRSGRIVEVNGTTLRITNTEADQLLDLNLASAPWWRDDESREEVANAIERARSGHFARTEVRFFDRNRSERILDLSVKPIHEKDDAVVLLLTEGRDITDFVRAREREVSMFKALASVGENAAVLAHEIKNPITSINLALRAVADRLEESHQTVLNELVTRLQRLESLMRETLVFARPLDLRFEPCELSGLLETVTRDLAAQAGAQEVRFRCEIEPNLPPVNADMRRLEEVFTNLLLNAVEAFAGAGRGGLVRIEARYDGAEEIGVWIEDDGPGIPESIRDRLFEPFVSAKDTGTGLGLAICRRVIESHGGRIAVGSSELGGARFRMFLPAFTAPETTH